jgi:predicted transcriptional regulator
LWQIITSVPSLLTLARGGSNILPTKPCNDDEGLSPEQLELIERFEADYNVVDHFLRNALSRDIGVPFMRLLDEYSLKHASWRDVALLKTIARVRNAIVHGKTEPYRHVAVPTPAIVRDLRGCLDRLTNAPRVIPTFERAVETILVHDDLSRVLKIIRDRDYSQFPVYEAEQFRGLLTENGITRWLAHQMTAGISVVKLDDVTVMRLLQNEENRQNYHFIAHDTRVDDVSAMFASHELLEAALITTSGKESEALLGIATRWDMIHPLSDPRAEEKDLPSTRAQGIPTFDRYIGIDYAGAETPTSSLKGLRVYIADRASPPKEVQPQLSPRKYWTRRDIAKWLVERLSEDRPRLVGIDHGFSFPLRYFEEYGLSLDWQAFLDDFQQHWPTDEDHTYVDFVREGKCGCAAARTGDAHWRRLTEAKAPGAKSVFHFDVPGSVAKSTHVGLTWLRYLRQHLRGRVHFWPFDGWEIPTARSLVAEVYPPLWSGSSEPEESDLDQHDAYSVAAWMRAADLSGSLAEFLKPSLTPAEFKTAQIEGWILGLK